MLLHLGGIKPFAPLVDASSTSAASLSTATPAQTRSSRADDNEHGRYNDHDEGGSLATLTDG
jgi:hypothetical protein